MAAGSAVVFDLDGLLVDSEPIWGRVTRALLAGHGFEYENVVAERHMGMRLADVVDVLLEHYPVATGRDAFGAELTDAVVAEFGRTLHPMPGAEDALSLVRALGLPTALASSSTHAVIDAALGRFGWSFDAVCSGDEVERGKPAPDIFRLAAKRLGVAADRCVALEDSRNGIRAAKAAGMKTIAVARDRAGADLVLASLEDLRPDHLRV